MSKNRDSLNWGSWYFAVPRTLAELPILDELTHQMETRRPAAADVQAALKKAREQMHTLHEQVAGWEEASAAARIKSLIDAGPLERDWSWDAAEQTFLSLYALNLAALDADLQTRLNRLLPVRAFPNGLNSPQSHPNRKEGFFPEGFFKSLRERR